MVALQIWDRMQLQVNGNNPNSPGMTKTPGQQQEEEELLPCLLQKDSLQNFPVLESPRHPAGRRWMGQEGMRSLRIRSFVIQSHSEPWKGIFDIDVTIGRAGQ